MAGVARPIQDHLVGKEMLAGSMAVGLADCLMCPVMTVKSRLQVQGSGCCGSTGTLYVYGGPLHAIRDIATKEGWRTFYKGSGTILVGIPSTALYMTTYLTKKRLLPGGQAVLLPSLEVVYLPHLRRE